MIRYNKYHHIKTKNNKSKNFALGEWRILLKWFDYENEIPLNFDT